MNPALRETAEHKSSVNWDANRTREDILHGAGHSANSLLNPPKDCLLGQYSTLAIFVAQVL